MSKAFTKDDAPPEALGDVDPADLVPAGSTNYLTAAGWRSFQDELARLQVTPERSDDVDRRRRYLSRLLEISRPIDPASLAGTAVRFGASVRLRGEDERELRYVIVGIHESDASRGRISWNSPLARALLGRKPGDVVLFRSPAAEEELEILGVEFEAGT